MSVSDMFLNLLFSVSVETLVEFSSSDKAARISWSLSFSDNGESERGGGLRPKKNV